MSSFDLVKYWSLFGDALEERYRCKNRFKGGFARIEALYQQVRPGRQCRDITVDDVLEIFEDDLPYVQDWSKPDRDDLARRMAEKRAAELIRRLAQDSDGRHLIGEIRYCFRDLGLTALVLHHVYPERFAMCSHHLASLLFVSGRTVPEFYVDYCGELLVWSEHWAHRRPRLSVVETEFALWTWYWFAHHSGDNDARRKHFRAFSTDPWVHERRADRIADALKGVDKMDLARSYVKTEPTVAAIIAWRELETELRRALGAPRGDEVRELIDRLDEVPGLLPAGWAGGDLKRLWCRTGPGRNQVMHDGREVSPKDAATIVNSVTIFLERNRLE
jgi:hypothetical protein